MQQSENVHLLTLSLTYLLFLLPNTWQQRIINMKTIIDKIPFVSVIAIAMTGYKQILKQLSIKFLLFLSSQSHWQPIIHIKTIIFIILNDGEFPLTFLYYIVTPIGVTGLHKRALYLHTILYYNYLSLLLRIYTT